MKKMWKNRGNSCGFCEETGGADVFEGQERDGRRRGRKDRGRMEKDGERTEGGRSRTIIHTRSGGAGIVT